MSESKGEVSQKDNDFELWKYYGTIGGNDKDHMIKIVTWLLGLSAGIIGFYATDKSQLVHAKFLLLLLGVVLSMMAAATALMYGGYAARNWAIADEIAKARKWRRQRPTHRPFKKRDVSWFSRPAICLAKPCQKKIAPVFWLFFFASIGSLSAHVVLLIVMAWRH